MSGAANFAAVGGGIPDTNIVLPGALSVGARINGIPCKGTFRLGSDKRIYSGEDHSNDFVNTFTIWTDRGAWCGAGGTAGDYEVLATINSGSLSSGTVGAWQQLNADRAWSVTDYTTNLSDPDNGAARAEITLQIRKASTQRIVNTATIDFDCVRMG